MHLNYNFDIHPSGHSPPQKYSLLYEVVRSIPEILKFILICHDPNPKPRFATITGMLIPSLNLILTQTNKNL